MKWSTMTAIAPLHNSGTDEDYERVIGMIQAELDDPQAEWTPQGTDFCLTVMRIELPLVRKHRATYEAVLAKAREIKVDSFTGSMRGAYMEELLKQVARGETPADGNFTPTPDGDPDAYQK